MKKQGSRMLIFITILFCVLIFGFLVGKNSRRGAIQVSVSDSIPAATPAPTLAASAVEQLSTVPVQTQPENVVTFPLNINAASREDLILLPGIGEVLSQRILDYRRVNGRFASVDELANIQGITKKTVEQLREYVTVGG